MKENARKSWNGTMDLMKLTVPILIETALVMMLGFVDVFVLGRYDDLAASGVNTANQAIIVISTAILVFSSAGGILVSQFLGAGNRETASRFAALSIVLHFLAGLAVSLLVFFCSGSILRFIGAKEQVFDYAQQYLRTVSISIVLSSVSTSMAVTLRSHGLTKLPMLVGIGVNVLNIVLDLLLVSGAGVFPAMGVRGAAAATFFSRAAGLAAMSWFLFRKAEKPSIFRLLRQPSGSDLKLLIKTGFPAAAESFLYHVSQLVITSLVLHFLSENELIAKTYLYNITFAFYLFSASVGQAAQILVGHQAGAGDFDAARKTGFRTFRLAILVTAMVCLAGIAARQFIISLFTNNAEVIGIASGLLIINLFLELGRTTNLTLIPCLRGAGDVTFPTGWAVFSNWLIGLGGAHLLGVVCGLGIYGLWIAMAMDEVFRAILMFFRWRGKRWENKTATAR